MFIIQHIARFFVGALLIAPIFTMGVLMMGWIAACLVSRDEGTAIILVAFYLLAPVAGLAGGVLGGLLLSLIHI